ncbi:LuxR C-terminal-related transcriptional regulator [Actinomadura litoris]|uniref:LuxR C-terminal-related transcriptional regulator n=1 Tax=Actinomadura litoris TaxID=2678616 RepID=UPI001FA71584|nr:response regulator transcription factor [Actinomadura litoris]
MRSDATMEQRSHAVRVLIVSNNPVVRIGLHALLRSAPMLDVVGNGGLGNCTAEARRLTPDVVLLDATPPPTADIGALGRAGHGGRIIVVTAEHDPAVLVETLMAGAHCCLVYGHFEPQGLAEVVLAADRGESHLSPPAATALVRWVHDGRPARVRPTPALTPREVEIIELIAAGLTNRQIARHLVISEKTVKNHAHQIYKRLDADGREHAIARWRELNSAATGDVAGRS